MNKFKVGDRVRVIDTTLLYYNEIGTIFEKRSNDVYDVIFEFNKEEKFRYVSDELELVEKENNMKEFTLSDLTDDMIVELRNGNKHLVIGNGKFLSSIDSWTELNHHKEDLTCEQEYKDLDIIKVWKAKTNYFWYGSLTQIFDELKNNNTKDLELVYFRKEPKKMTLSQICDELGYDVEIVKE